MTKIDHLSEAIKSFQDTRQMTYDLLDVLTPAQLVEKLPRPDLDTFGKHFQELGDTQEAYTLGIINGVMDFGVMPTRIDYELVASKERLKAFLQEKDRLLYQELKGRTADQVIEWEEGEKISLAEQLSRLVMHETFHHGQLASYAYLLGISFPKSWIATWVLPSRAGELYRN